MTSKHNGEPVEPKWDATDPKGSFRRYAEFLHAMARLVFLKDKTHVEMMFIYKSGGECLLMLVRGDRDEFIGKLKELIRGSDVIGVVHIAEAWTRFGGRGDHITTQLVLGEMRVSDLRPEDNGEALMISMQSRDGQVLTWIEPILRDADGKPSLGEGFEINEINEIGGRFGRLFK